MDAPTSQTVISRHSSLDILIKAFMISFYDIYEYLIYFQCCTLRLLIKHYTVCWRLNSKPKHVFLVSPYQTHSLFDGCLLGTCNYYIINFETIGSLFSIAPRTKAQSPLFCSRQRQTFFFFPTARNPVTTRQPIKCVPKALFLEGKLANHLRTYTVEVMNLSSYTSTPPYVFTVRCFKQKNIFDFTNYSLSPSVQRAFVNATWALQP